MSRVCQLVSEHLALSEAKSFAPGTSGCSDHAAATISNCHNFPVLLDSSRIVTTTLFKNSNASQEALTSLKSGVCNEKRLDANGTTPFYNE